MFEVVTNLDGDLYQVYENVFIMVTDKAIFASIVQVNDAVKPFWYDTVSYITYRYSQSPVLKEVMQKMIDMQDEDSMNAYNYMFNVSQNVGAIEIYNKELLSPEQIADYEKVPNDTIEFVGLAYKLDIDEVKKLMYEDASVMSVRSPLKTRIK